MMARLYQLTAEQSREYDADPWRSIAIEQDVIDWADTHNIHAPVVVTTPEHTIVFALTWKGERV